MKKNILIIISFSLFLALAFLVYFVFFWKSDTSSAPFSESEARAIAESGCASGSLLAAGYYNDNSKTWWFDADIESAPAGCNPACVVSEETRRAELNWRCTGLTEPDTGTTTGSGLDDLIRVDHPLASQAVDSPVEISGKARGNWFFEASFPASLHDSRGNVLAQVPISAEGDWMTEDFVPFRGSIAYQVPATTSAVLVLENDNPSGLPEKRKRLEIPLILAPSAGSLADTLDVRLYFMNDKLDPDFTCNKAFPVTRRIAKTQAVASATIAQLLAGPTEAEKTDGYSSTINPGTKVRALVIADGVARIDFDKAIEEGVGGSCRVTAIRTEIIETLKQFPTVREVIISVEGRTDDALQP